MKISTARKNRLHRCSASVRMLAMCIALIIISVSAIAQTGSLERSLKASHSRQYYKLSDDDLKEIGNCRRIAERLLKDREPDIEVPRDSILADSEIQGYWIEVYASKDMVHFNSISNFPFEAELITEYEDLHLEVRDLSGNLIHEGVSVEVQGKKILHNPTTQSFLINDNERLKNISVSYSGLERHYYINGNYYRSGRSRISRMADVLARPYRRKWRKLVRATRGDFAGLIPKFHGFKPYRRFGGYMAFNKPIYRPADTVKVKALIVNKKGKPIRRKRLQLQFKPVQMQPVIIKNERASRGSFVAEFVLGDSLKLDRSHVLNFQNRSGKYNLLSRSFSIDDYELDKVDFHFRPGIAVRESEEPPYAFYAQAKEKNGLNALDANAELELTVWEIFDVIPDSLFLQFTLWEHARELDAFGETKISVPDSLLPPANLRMGLRAKLSNSDGETDTFRENWTHYGIPSQAEILSEGNELIFQSSDSKAQNDSCRLILKYHDSAPELQWIQLPHREVLKPAVKQYQLVVEKDVATLSPAKDLTLATEFLSRRTADSLHIWLENPYQLPVRYEIYNAAGEVLKQDFAKEATWSIKDKHQASYAVQYAYFLGGKWKQQQKSLSKRDKELLFDITAPEVVYPGQSTAISLRAMQQDGSPAAHTNLTLGGYNAGFEDVRLSSPPYLGENGNIYKQKHRHYMGETPCEYKMPLDSIWLKKLSLDSMPFYRFRYPKEEVYISYEPIEELQAQIAPFLFFEGKYQSPKMILIDDQLLFADDRRLSRPFSFAASEGYHKVCIHTHHATVTIDSVLFKKQHKIYLSLDYQYPHKNVEAEVPTSPLAEQIAAAIPNQIFRLRCKDPLTVGYIQQEDKYFPISLRGRNQVLKLFPIDKGPLSLYLVEQDTTIQLEHDPQYDWWLSGTALEKVERKSISEYKPNGGAKSLYQWKDRALSYDDMPKPSTKSKPEKKNKNPGNRGNNTLLIHYESDSTIVQVNLASKDRDDSFRKMKRQNNGVFKLGSLSSGWYQLEVITQNAYKAEVDSVFVPNGGFQFYRLRNLQFEFDAKYKVAGRTSHRSGVLQGTVTDGNLKEGLAFANVSLHRAEQTVMGAQTDFEGNFEIRNIPPGRYLLKIQYVGYESYEERIQISHRFNPALHIELSEGTQLLESVVVTSYSMPVSDLSGFRGSQLLASTVGFEDDQCWDSNQNGKMDAEEDTNQDGQWDEADCQSNLLDKIGEQSMTEQSGLRKNFRDYAFWVPDLITDTEGKASFDVSFPDNITAWNCFALGMDYKLNSGVAKFKVPAIKLLSARLACPRFLREGDQCTLVGKSISYMQEEKSIQTHFNVDSLTVLSQKQHQIIQDAIVDHHSFRVGSQDSVKLAYQLSMDNYIDGEERSIPVYPLGTEEAKGSFSLLEKNDSLSIEIDPRLGPVHIHMEQDLLPTLQRSLYRLRSYKYLCTEQTASKLTALLIEQKLANYQDKKFRHKRAIRKLIKRLQDIQDNQGKWGWWPGGRPHSWMSSYALKALHEAEKLGYKNKAAEKSIKQLLWSIGELEGRSLLDALEVLSLYDAELDFPKYLSLLQDSLQSQTNQLRLLNIKRQQGIHYDLQEVMALKKESILGNYYWGTPARLWYQDDLLACSYAYQLIKAKNPEHEALARIRRYLLEVRSHGRWRNTLQSATALDILSDYYIKSDRKSSNNKVKIIIDGEAQIVENFPFSLTVPASQLSIISQSSQLPLYCTSYQKFWNQNPKQESENFEITTSFLQNGKPLSSLKQGESATLQVELKVKKQSAEYAMLEIPIPAGCSYSDSGSRWLNSSYREQFRDRQMLYFPKLNAGTYTFNIKLDARFAGEYQLNPTKLELMYFPTIYGRNEISSITIH